MTILNDFKVKDKAKVISNLFVLFGASNAVCSQEKNSRKQYYPCNYTKDVIHISSRTANEKSKSDKKCWQLDNQDNGCQCISTICFKEYQNVQRRLSQIKRNKLFCKELRTKEYHNYESLRFKDLTSMLRNKIPGGKNHPFLKDTKLLKQYIKTRWLMSRLKEEIKKSRDKYGKINLLALYPIADYLYKDLPRTIINKICEIVAFDPEFLSKSTST